MWRSLLLAYVTQLQLIDKVVIKTFTSSSGYFIVWLLKYERAGCLFRMNGFLTFNYSWQQNPALPRAIVSLWLLCCVSELQRFWSAVMTSLIVGLYHKTVSLLSTVIHDQVSRILASGILMHEKYNIQAYNNETFSIWFHWQVRQNFIQCQVPIILDGLLYCSTCMMPLSSLYTVQVKV